ncbi:hypothetical protein SAMN06265371_102360 [Lutibacter agarilyticus]|uniref:Phenylalanyl-tRNA synthetase subunit alpha n=1 Tax=Lutibacter agarilyticus TaxID=1109740 RepID=A0A238W241_9FLAO|nr:hypothetical protein [Lutibacter agarilyticus]SNR40665.1 hypothetical protein SAMN06265371_102360 [Lutibacter agarilyticus]
MKKDIELPEVSNVFMAVVKEYNNEFKCDDWNAYIINNKTVDLEMVLIVSKGYDEDKLLETAVLRHKIEKLPAQSYAKVELLQEDVLKLANFFNVTFFEGSKMYDKKYLFEKGIIKEGNLRNVPLLNKRGILIK